MRATAARSRGILWVTIVAVAMLGACTQDELMSPADSSPSSELAAASSASARAAELGVCQNLDVPQSSELVFSVFAVGVQIYRWNGTSWTFVAPDAALFADNGGSGRVGTHYAGPTWKSNSGSTVVGRVLDRCTPNASAIAWLLLEAVSSEGPGIFHRITYIQRLNTAGGLAPVQPGTTLGEEARVPYTTDYFFYRSE